MKHARVLVAFVGIFFCLGELRAQGPIPGGIAIGFSGRRVSGGIFLSPYGPGPGFYPPPPGPFYGPPPFGTTYISSSVTIYPPGMIDPRMTEPQPPQRTLPPQLTFPLAGNISPGEEETDIRDGDFPNKIVVRPRRQAPQAGQQMKRAEVRERPLPGAPAGEFRAVVPEDRARARQPLQERPMPAAPVEPPPIPPPQRERPKVDLDPYARQITLGRQAFAEGEFGRAVVRFQQATRLKPDEPVGYFFLAQAQFAVGKYREAVASIHAGLRLQPDWPLSPFRSRELYGDNAKDFAEHMTSLAEALKRDPDDPVLLFLQAYELWFDGRQNEARPLFRKAAALVANPRFIDLFLNAQQGGRVVSR